MKGFLYIPIESQPFMIDRWNIYFEMLAQRFGFKLEFNSKPEVPLDTDLVIVYNSPCHAWGEAMMNLVDLPKHIKMIFVGEDLHYFQGNDNRVLIQNMSKMFDRYDLILTAVETIFLKYWSPWKEKMVFFPEFFAPHERYASLPWNNNPEMKVVISGDMTPHYYPFRNYCLKVLDPQKVFRPPHPGFHLDVQESQLRSDIFVGDNYARMLNRFFCGLTCGSYEHALAAKHIEIPAAGALLLGENNADVTKAGFIPGTHFVEINEKNVIEVVDDVLNNPSKYEGIRKAGCEFSRANFSVNNRIEEIEGWIKKLFSLT